MLQSIDRGAAVGGLEDERVALHCKHLQRQLGEPDEGGLEIVEVVEAGVEAEQIWEDLDNMSQCRLPDFVVADAEVLQRLHGAIDRDRHLVDGVAVQIELLQPVRQALDASDRVEAEVEALEALKSLQGKIHVGYAAVLQVKCLEEHHDELVVAEITRRAELLDRLGQLERLRGAKLVSGVYLLMC